MVGYAFLLLRGWVDWLGVVLGHGEVCGVGGCQGGVEYSWAEIVSSS